jgi:putative endonuclease
MYYVYVLKSVNFNKVYVGLTTNIDKRLIQHNSGKIKSNKAYTPFIVVYFETFKTREDARKKEKYFKAGAGRRYLTKIGIK